MAQFTLEQQHVDTPICDDWMTHSTAGGTLEEYLIGAQPGQMPEIEARQRAANAQKIKEIMDRARSNA